jgi:hypothetical protein
MIGKIYLDDSDDPEPVNESSEKGFMKISNIFLENRFKCITCREFFKNHIYDDMDLGRFEEFVPVKDF